jgi:hypothetical protein
MKRDIWLFDPVGGGIVESPGYLRAIPALYRVIGTVEVNKQPFDPGELLVTQAALELVGDKRVCQLFIAHLLAQWEGLDEDGIEENNIALDTGAPLYNRPEPGLMIVTHQGNDSTLILREEY